MSNLARHIKHWFSAKPKLADWREYRYLALDLELSSLDPHQGEILSIGWVPVKPPSIYQQQGVELLIKDPGDLGQSPVIHGLTRKQLNSGISLKEALGQLLDATAQDSDNLWLLHHAGLDLAFLRKAFEDCGLPFETPRIVDTFRLEQRLLMRRGKEPQFEGLTLDKCRQRYGLDGHPAHNALEDALATAELFLCHGFQNFGKQGRTLSDLLSRP
ncbi:3'-5' exonuclease [Bowmanella pacifica]|uniref:DNA polymerase III subunit epsilon n=1 Tax=Bowmanella pacifica TaxID=502051 RepID=A0A918DJQ0_9ALTE|nr:3'-5' exonuclease [Bowmanella pacifica]GGO70748.1 DNA polymerase III subunit epsilon [Bowmanella pacifica]